MKSHPGGKFVLKHNIGRDISKFFYGGHTLENIDYVAPYTHSATAKNIANKLAIARLSPQNQCPPSRLMKIHGIDRETNQTGTCCTIKFKSIEERNPSTSISL